MECMDSIAPPTSTVRKPSLLNIGPTVEPQGLCHHVNMRTEADGGNVYLHIIPDFELLDLSPLALDELLHKETTNRVACVALLGVGFDDDTLVHLRLVFGLVLLFVIGMDRMTHIRGNQKRPSDRLTVSRGSRRKSFYEGWNEGGLGASGRDAPDLFVVEEGDAVHVSVRFLALRHSLESAEP